MYMSVYPWSIFPSAWLHHRLQILVVVEVQTQILLSVLLLSLSLLVV